MCGGVVSSPKPKWYYLPPTSHVTLVFTEMLWHLCQPSTPGGGSLPLFFVSDPPPILPRS